jgi:hypothetical protein
MLIEWEKLPWDCILFAIIIHFEFKNECDEQQFSIKRYKGRSVGRGIK